MFKGLSKPWIPKPMNARIYEGTQHREANAKTTYTNNEIFMNIEDAHVLIHKLAVHLHELHIQ